MSGNTIFFVELVFFHGAVLGWAFWELWTLRRDKRRDAAASAERARLADGQRPDV